MVALATCMAFLPATARQSKPLTSPVKHRCATMELQQQIIARNPGILQEWKAEGEKQFKAWQQRQHELQLIPEGGPVTDGSPAPAIIIPVVFHLVGSAAILNEIPDRDIYAQIEILNRDFNGEKAAVYKGMFAPELAARIGNIPVRFVLARRTPAGNHSSGIERRNTNETFSGGTDGSTPTLDRLKSTLNGGLDAWDPSKYLNIWCATFSDALLGIATFPHTNASTAGPQGVAIDLYTLGSNPCRSYYPTYSEGATLAHEIGHYFYLYHTFGDLSFCNNTDFNIEPGWPLTPAATLDDTPPERGAQNYLYGNLSGVYSDGCAVDPFGIMYQNFMNYFDDRALYMFSSGQKERVMATIDMYRSGLKTSNGATPPSAVTDAWLVTASPLGKCDGAIAIINQIPITVTIRNYGTTVLNSLNVDIQIDGGTPATTTFPLTLQPGADTVLQVGTINQSPGNYILSIALSAPNGTTDNYPENNRIDSYINIRGNSLTAPFTESFSADLFPPRLVTAGDLWTMNNPSGTGWSYSSTAGAEAAGSALFPNNFVEATGETDELISPPIDFGANDSALLIFKVAHAQRSNIVSDWDGLEVYVSADGGQHYQLAYKKVSNQLKTVTPNQNSAFTPGIDASKWRSHTINLTPRLIAGQQLFIKFRNVNANGNHLYLDDIQVTTAKISSLDIVTSAVTNLPPFLCNSGSVTPSLVFSNFGSQTVTSLQLNYRLDNGAVTTIPWTGTLPKGTQATQVLNTLNNLTPGLHTLTAYTSNPNGQPDNRLTNDTIRVQINVLSTVDLPLQEGFETSTFPPVNWGLISSGQAYTWEKTIVASKAGSGSMWIRNYRFAGNNKPDQFYSYPANVGQVDSIHLLFDLAHATMLVPGEIYPTDTLEVLITKDCGNTFTSVYKKWGTALETTGDPNNPINFNRISDLQGFVPFSNQWRNEKIDLTQLIADNSSFQVMFRNTSNNDNNLFIDNINLHAIQIPESLRNNGYLVAPNPFQNWFYIRHLNAPTDLKYIEVVNAAGQIVYRKTFNGNAGNYLRIDLNNVSSGVYMVKMTYQDKVITRKLVKVN